MLSELRLFLYDENVQLHKYHCKYEGGEMNTKQLIEEAVSLPLEERAIVVDSLLRSLNQPESEIDKQWAHEAKRRLSELRSGHTEAIPGNDVFSKVWDRFEK